MSELNELEQKFFETGVLPEGLTPAQGQTEPVTATPDPAVDAAVPRQDDQVAILQTLLKQEQQLRLQNEEKYQQLLQKALTPPAADAPKAPDEATDPLGNIIHQTKQLAEHVKKVDERLEADTARQTAAQEFNTFVTNVQTMRDEFLKTTPDYTDAYKYLRGIITENMKDMGVPETHIPQVLMQEELRLAQQALGAGKNPAQLLYNVAKRYGYKQQAASTPESKIESIKKGQEAAKTIPSAKPSPEVSLEALKTMAEDDLDKIVTNDDLWHKVMGKTRPGVV